MIHWRWGTPCLVRFGLGLALTCQPPPGHKGSLAFRGPFFILAHGLARGGLTGIQPIRTIMPGRLAELAFCVGLLGVVKMTSGRPPAGQVLKIFKDVPGGRWIPQGGTLFNPNRFRPPRLLSRRRRLPNWLGLHLSLASDIQKKLPRVTSGRFPPSVVPARRLDCGFARGARHPAGAPAGAPVGAPVEGL